MLSFHAASITASCVRTEYPSQSGAQDIPKRSPRIRGPDSKNNVDRLSAGIVSVRHNHMSSTLVEWVGYTMFAAAGAQYHCENCQ